MAKIVAWEQDRCFVDVMLKGTFKDFRHTHLFQPLEGGTLVVDLVDFTLGYTAAVDQCVAMPLLDYSFRKRHAALREFFVADSSM